MYNISWTDLTRNSVLLRLIGGSRKEKLIVIYKKKKRKMIGTYVKMDISHWKCTKREMNGKRKESINCISLRGQLLTKGERMKKRRYCGSVCFDLNLCPKQIRGISPSHRITVFVLSVLC